MNRRIGNIYSCDVDLIFECEEYAKYMNYDLEPNLSWEIIDLINQKSKDIRMNLEPNKKALNKLISILKEKVDKNTIIRIIDEHDEIVDILEEFNCEDSTMFNYDFHCDLNYGNDNTELNIENWVIHSKKKGLIDKYYWIHRELSDVYSASQLAPFIFNRDNLLDIKNEYLPKADLLIICISHHFTPKKYWKEIPNLILKEINPLKHFTEIIPNSFDLSKLNGLDDYLIDGTYPSVFRVFRNNETESYIIVEKECRNKVNLSMVSFDKKTNLFQFKEVVEYLLKEFKYIEFEWKKGIRNEKYIKHLSKQFNIEYESENKIIIKGEW